MLVSILRDMTKLAKEHDARTFVGRTHDFGLCCDGLAPRTVEI